MKKKAIMVTGGAGFIGTNFVRGVLNMRPDWYIVNLDILTYGDLVSEEMDIPRGEITRYAFVLKPLAQVAAPNFAGNFRQAGGGRPGGRACRRARSPAARRGGAGRRRRGTSARRCRCSNGSRA